MIAENSVSTNQGKEKQKQTSVKLQWIFGIRRDILPNVLMLDSETLVYAASHYIVIFNHTRKLPYSQVQQFISGTPHSKGFVAFNVLNVPTIHKRYIGAAEEITEGATVSIYSLINSQGMYNLPNKLVSVTLYDISVTKVFHLAFSQRDQPNNNYFALVGMSEEPTLVLWKWEFDNLKDRLVYIVKPPCQNYKFLQISFSVYRNDHFVIVSDKFFCSYSCRPYEVKFTFSLEQAEIYGTTIHSHCWFFDGNFCICTDTHILIFDTSFKIIQAIETLRTINESSTCITTVLPLLDTFVAAGQNRRFEIYERKTDLYEKTAEKKVFEYNQNLNEKYDKNSNSDKLENSDKEKMFDFLTLTGPNSPNEQYVVATTSFNDIIQIGVNIKDLESQTVKHLIAPFHSDSIEGMDVCVNKPYIITCSVDKSLRVWDYTTRSLTHSKNFDEEMFSVAYHPNGMHAVVSFLDKILPLHIFYDEIANLTQNAISLKSNFRTKDIKFSNGGQFFAFDSGSKVEIWDFLNMMPYYVHNADRKREFGSNKLNSINWRYDDQILLVAGYEHISEWPFTQKNDDTRKFELRNYNINCGNYIGNTIHMIVVTDDGYIRKINSDSMTSYTDYKFDHIMKEMTMFNKSKFMVCCTTIAEKSNNSNSMTTLSRKDSGVNSMGTTCLRLFLDINSKKDYIDIPSHFGETTRVRVNYDENMVFTTGADGCINVYSIETSYEGEDDKIYLEKYSDHFTSTVLIKKSKLRERDLERKDLPEKRDEKLKKVKAENADKREKLQKDLATIKNNLSLTKRTESMSIKQLQNTLEDKVNFYIREINNKRTQYNNEYEKAMNDYQVELATMNREVEDIRQSLKKMKDDHKRDMQDIRGKHSDDMLSLEKDYQKQISDLESHKAQLEEKIRMLGEKKELDGHTIEWLNNKILNVIDKNIEDLKRGIEDLSVHNAHQIKKLKEEKEKLNTTLSNLQLENKQISEETEKQKRNTAVNKEKKKMAENEMKQIQDRITEVENKIIEGKKRNQYLEKCKFVLDYKIKELKKEMGPIEKAIEDLKKRTKDLDVELEKFNREHDIINKRLIDFNDLESKIEELKFEERKESNQIKMFKNTIFNMINRIDDFEYLREGFRSLRDVFLKDYTPDKQDMELDAEFLNQKDNMKKNVEDLQKQLKEVKVKHVESIEHNRIDNHQLIKRINKLQDDIKSEKDRKGEQAADNRHANAIAAIKAQKKISRLDEMEFESTEHKVRYLEELIEEKKKILNREKGLESDSLVNIIQSEEDDNEDDDL
jgi:cilia- and flagella-associated protein 57